jgi:hypothetical protein
MPNPEFEGVARQIRASLVKAGGEALAELVYDKKVRDGETVLTRIHHRQTPLFLMQHLVEAGVTWRSEAIFQEQIGNPIGHVDIPTAVNTLANYSAAMVAGAPHPEAARAGSISSVPTALSRSLSVTASGASSWFRNRCSGETAGERAPKVYISGCVEVLFAISDSFTALAAWTRYL